MRRRIFADTSALYELIDENARHHREVADFVRENAPNIRLIITDYVFDELVTLVMTKLGKSYAVRMGERLLSSEFCSIVKVEQEDLKAAWEVFCRYRDKEWSFTDCTSFRNYEAPGYQRSPDHRQEFRSDGVPNASLIRGFLPQGASLLPSPP